MGDDGALLVSELYNIGLVSQISTVFTNCLREKSLYPLESTTSIPDKIKQQLSVFLDGRLEKKVDRETEWKVNVVVNNQHVQKSLHVITEINIHGQKLEFDLEQFAKFRQELARSMLALEKYQPNT
uniref:COMM domain-containing protein n=1 Tax=Heterorhabditis bacteriophora TaxID=37862 RepID=A0A1I7X598_HETBA